MNAITAAVWDVENPGITAMLSSAQPAQARLPTRIPVFRGATHVGFVDRDNPREATRAGQWTTQEIVEISIENGVAHLLGEVDDIHDVLTLRRIAATMPGVTAIADHLWISCE